MEDSIYKKMLELKDTLNSNDVIYVGTITLTEIDPVTNEKIQISKDIMVPINIGPDAHILKFFDENNELIAVDNGIGIYPSSQYADIFNMKENADVLSALSKVAKENGISLNDTSSELEEISKQLGIPKEHILSISKAENSSQRKESEEDDKIHLKEDEENKKSKENTRENTSEKDTSTRVHSKGVAPLSQKIDGVHTLGYILGVPSDGSLVVVHSRDIANNDNNTKFSFLIQNSDGTFSQPENLKQIAGTHSSLNVAASNRDGSEISQEQYDSSYMIAHNNINYVLVAKSSDYGYPSLGFGQLDRTQGYNNSSVITVPIETTNTYYHTTQEVKEDLVNPRSGTMQATRRNDELEEHTKADCNEQITSKEADGRLETGHQHTEEATLNNIAERIYNSDDAISYAFSRNDIKNMIQTAINNHQDQSIEQIESTVTKDCQLYVDSISRKR